MIHTDVIILTCSGTLKKKSVNSKFCEDNLLNQVFAPLQLFSMLCSISSTPKQGLAMAWVLCNSIGEKITPTYNKSYNKCQREAASQVLHPSL